MLCSQNANDQIQAKTDIFDAIANNDEAGVRRAVADGAPVDGKRGDGVTPLLFACSHLSFPIIGTLLEVGADPDLPSNEGLLPEDFAQNYSEIAILLRAARGQREAGASVSTADVGPIRSWTSSDLAEFLETAELVLPKGGMECLRGLLRSTHGEEGAKEAERELAKTNYRVLFEQIFAPESLGCAYLTADNKLIRSPMALGKYDVGLVKRRNIDLLERFKSLFEKTDALLWNLLPDELFVQPPRLICEIGGAWGATMKHLTQRFSPEVYQNYEPDRYYAQWAAERFGATKMPVDGETLRGTESDSIDLVIANNVLTFVPPIKVWSYMREMRRVIRKNGIILFNAVLSDQLTERDLDHYIDGYFPKRQIQIVPSDIIYRTLPEPQFHLVRIYEKEYCIFRKVS